ncbi:hypothetical protein [Marinoscillum sp.]|uniref:hypothetical protein n=1 Tax=Marinoscillum sp. TaxID=2024838 RepID=UPI003BAAEB89
MKQSTLKLCVLLLTAIPLMFLASCETDEPKKEDDTNEFLPVLDENFEYQVDGNDVNFTTTINGNVWVTVNDVDYNFADKKVTVNLPNQGDYTFTCSSLGSGEILSSDPFTVTIEQDDLSFLDEGLWKSLSGGANKTKTWRLDINADAETKYFVGPMFFSGFENEEIGRQPYWAWDVLPEDLPYDLQGNEMTGFFNWSPDYENNTWIMPAANYGTITFDGTNQKVTATDVFGEESEGSFSFNDETWKLTLTGVILPIDTGRLYEPQFTDENLGLVRIFTLTDSAMQIGIKRSYEGFDEEGNQIVSEWTNVYNFIVVGYDYPEAEEFTYAEPVDTEFTAADLEGTWVYADAPFDWIGWTGTGNQGTIIPAVPLNGWADAAAMLAADWLGISQAQLDAAHAMEFTFGDDGSVTVGDVTTTYTVDAGVITFGEAVTFNIGDHWFSVSGTSVKKLSVPDQDGIWIGNQNESKAESACVHLIKQ